MYQALARKWRPKNFNELVGQKHVTQSLCYSLDQGHIHHAYLFTGTRGVGKTTIARIFAKSINCLNHGVSSNPCGVCEHCTEIDAGRFPDLIEVDAASRTQVDNTRQLLNSVPYQPMKGRYKVYLIDEVHMLSDGSFNALLKTLEEPPAHVKFILATTDPQKIPATVISRCLQFQLKNMSATQISNYLKHILQEEKVRFDTEALQLLAEAGQGSMRDSLSLLDQAISYGRGQVLTEEVANLLGAVPAMQVRRLFYFLAKGDARALREHYCALEVYAPDYSELLKRILYGLQEISVAQLKAERYSGEVHPELVQIAEVLPVELVQLWYQVATDAWQSLPYQPNMALAVEMALLRMLALQGVLPEQDLHEVKVPKNPPYLPDLPTVEHLQEGAQGEKKAQEKAHGEGEAQEASSERFLDDDWEARGASALSSAPAHDAYDEAEEEGLLPWEEDDNDKALAQQDIGLSSVAVREEKSTPAFEDATLVQEKAQVTEATRQEDVGLSSVAVREEKSTPIFDDASLAQEKAQVTEATRQDELISWQRLQEVLNQPLKWEAMLKALPAFKSSSFVWENLYPVQADDNGVLVMACDEAGRLWASAENLNKLNGQLSQLFARKVRVVLQEGVASTAYHIHREDLAEEKALKKERFKRHTNVQRLLSELGASIDEDSIS